MTDVATLSSSAQPAPSHGLAAGTVDHLTSGPGFGACLMPMLSSLGWLGSQTELLEALPHVADRLDLIDFRNTLAELGYRSERHTGRMRRIDTRLLPCLFLVGGRAPIVVHARTERGFRIFDSADQTVREIDGKGLSGYYYTFERFTDGEGEAAARRSDAAGWISNVARRFHGEAGVVVATSVLSSFFGLAIPLFVMAVYDIVIPAGSERSLYWLAPGAALAITVDFVGRRIRARALAHISGRADFLLATESFRRVLELPPAAAENSGLAAQISRLKSFQGLRDLVNSPLLSASLDLPLIVAAHITIAVIAGSLVLVPLGALGLLVLIGVLMVPAVRRAELEAANARAARDQLVTEMVTRQRAVREAVIEDSFYERLRPLSAQAANARAKAANTILTLQTIGHAMVIGSGLVLLLFGAQQVVAGVVSTGALVASMALVWRILVPIQMIFQSLPKMSQAGSTVAQINRLMKLQPERRDRSSHVEEKRFEKAVSAHRISVRYSDDVAPALLAASLNTEPGKLVAITGPSGAGKTTLLKVIAGLLRPQAGSVFYGGIEQRHIEPVELRRSVAYLPQTAHFFHGTIAQNLRLANPIADDADLLRAAEQAGLAETIAKLPDGFETWLGDERMGSLSESFLQKLALARIWLKDAPIILLDEPQQNLDRDGDRHLIQTLEELRPSRTIILVTHRPSLVRMADEVVHLRDGRVVEGRTVTASITDKQDAAP